MSEKSKVINVKLDAETKSKFETLAYLQDMSLQDLTLQLIKDSIDANGGVIADAEQLRAKFKQ